MRKIVSTGIVVLDDVFFISQPLRAGEKHRARRVETVVGGNAANACLAIARLGGRPSLVARLGDDTEGAHLQGRLAAEGIDLSLSRALPGCRSSRSAIVIEPDGSRTIINHFDAAFPEVLDWFPVALPKETAAVLGDTRWEAGARHVFGLARKLGIPAVFDGDRKPVDPDLVALASHAVFSAQGFLEWTGDAGIEDGLRRMARATAGFLAVTDGARGVFALEGGGIRHYPAFTVEAVDTLGAGDVWHGAFTLALGEGMTHERAIRFASAVAAIKCCRPGGATGTPDRGEVEAFLLAHPAD
jgi:sulfofructose kinase